MAEYSDNSSICGVLGLERGRERDLDFERATERERVWFDFECFLSVGRLLFFGLDDADLFSLSFDFDGLRVVVVVVLDRRWEEGGGADSDGLSL